MPLMKAVLRPPTAPLIAVTEFPLDLSVQYLAGGGAPGLPVVLRAQVNPKRVTPPEGFEEFTFANGALTEGIVRRGAGGDEVLDEDDPGEGAAGAGRERPGARAADSPARGAGPRRRGTARATIKGLAEATTPRDVLAELEFRDPNGETQTVSTRVPLWPAAHLVGLKPEGWAASRERLKGTGGRDRRARRARRRRARRGGRLRAHASTPTGSAWSAASTPTSTWRRSAAPARSAGASPTPRGCSIARACRPSRVGSCCRPPRRIRRPPRRANAGSLGRRRRRVVVRRPRQRPHRPPAGAAALRAGRDRAPAGAHAVPRGDGAGHASSAKACSTRAS